MQSGESWRELCSATNFVYTTVYEVDTQPHFRNLIVFQTLVFSRKVNRFGSRFSTWHHDCLVLAMKHNMIVVGTIAGLLGGYAAIVYALVYVAVLIDRSYFLSLAM
jgi:hypothetical protein